MWTVNTVRASKRPSEMFQTLMEKAYYSWNVFLGAPDILCECWKIWGIFVFVYIKRRVNKETVSICSLLGLSIAVHKRKNLFVQKKKKKSEDLTIRRKDIYQSKNIAYIFFLIKGITHMTCAQCNANQFLPLISESICPCRHRLHRF